MDLRLSALVASVAWALGATVAAVGLFVYVSNRPGAAPDTPSTERIAPGGAPAVPATVRHQLDQQAKIARELAAQVANLESTLAENRLRLREAKSLSEKFRKESQESMSLALQLLEQGETTKPAETRVDVPMSETPAVPGRGRDAPGQEAPAGDMPTPEELRERVAELETEAAAMELEQEAALERLLRRDLALRDETIRVLRSLGPLAAEPVAEGLRHPDPDIRIWAAHMLTRLGRDGRDVYMDLQAASKDPDARVRAAVQEAIRAVGE